MVENEEHENTRNHDQCVRLHDAIKMIKNKYSLCCMQELL